MNFSFGFAMITVVSLAVTSTLSFGSSFLESKVTMEGNTALKFYKSLNVEEVSKTLGEKIIRSKTFRVLPQSKSDTELNLKCTYVEMNNEIQNPSCEFHFVK